MVCLDRQQRGLTKRTDSCPFTINTSAVLGSKPPLNPPSFPHPRQQIFQHSLSFLCSHSLLLSLFHAVVLALGPLKLVCPLSSLSQIHSFTHIWLFGCRLGLDATCANVSVFFFFQSLLFFNHLSFSLSVSSVSIA